MNIKEEMNKDAKMHFVQLKGRTFIEEGKFIARCDSLGISDHGDTEKEAVENLGKTICLFFSSCMKRGTFERFLREKGLEPIGITGDAGQGERIFVPLVLLSNPHAGSSGDQRGMSD